MTDAAVALIVEHGIAAATLAAIGERAGYSRGLVTHRYGTKAKLLAHLHDTFVADWIARVQQAVGEHSGVEALSRVADALYGFIEEAPDEMRVMYLLRYASIDPGAAFRTSVARAHKAQRRDVQRWIEGGQKAGTVDRRVDAALSSELFCATVDGLIYRWLVNPKIASRALHELLKKQITLAIAAREST
ncbi:TetR/AcrR family transcriptional regulator [Solimonas terrae]|uniref:TetR/AcrR family transcriptional regulator n=2 Tax=Solimonas terrae TaxID=1396819 RepID=A0A6M2BQK6_9GAMM|nr:TetR/AcrR family transcriptional regulator [Solimonas terrae]